MKTIVLMGNPNVGKSVVFSRLTGAQVITSNYPGSTVDFSSGRMCIAKEVQTIVDAPGTYSLVPANSAENVAAEMFASADLVINVVDATNLERNLYLTLEMLEQKKPVIVALNMWDEAQHTGVIIDVEALSLLLHVPVVPTVALSGEGISELVSRFDDAKSPAEIRPMTEEERWVMIGTIVKSVQQITHRHHTIWDRLADASIMPLTGLPLALLVLALAFMVVRVIGETLIGYIFDPLFELWTPVVMQVSAWLGPGLLGQILVGQLFDGQIDYVQSMGLLTTGLYVPFAMVLPYIIAFYTVLAIFEDSGYLPRLATLTDNIFHKLGMHGYGIVPVCLGFGCNVPGVLATRNLETRKQRFIAATLLAMCIPCMAQTAMIFGVLGSFGMVYVALVFFSLFWVYVAGGLLLHHMIGGVSPEICLEIPPYRRPDARAVAKKTWMRVHGFLLEAIPYLFLGVFLINLLYAVGFISWLAVITAPVITGWFGLSAGSTTALLVGFLRKDLAVGMLLPLAMSPLQLVIATTLLTISFPCVGTFAVLLKELGLKGLFAAVCFMVTTAFIVGGIMRVVLLGI